MWPATKHTMQLETVGEMVRVLRSRRRLEQIELARACGWRDASAVSRIETDRVRPTRRTLTKLAESLATDPADVPEIRSWFFLAAGVLPSAGEVGSLDLLSTIDDLPNPSMIQDFAWNVWRVNPALQRIVPLPHNVAGRNFMTMMFDPNGPLRERLDSDWSAIAALSVAAFRNQTERFGRMRWHRKLLEQLIGLPGFAECWGANGQATRDDFHNVWTGATSRGRFAVVRTPLRIEPRLVLMQILPKDGESARALLHVLGR